MNVFNNKEFYLFLLKWLPVAGTALIAVHYTLLLFGFRTFILDYITDTSLFAWIFLYASSRLFFCKLHRHFIIYIGVASLDINMHHWLGWHTSPVWLMPVFMSIIALALIIYAFAIKCVYGKQK